MKRIICPIDFSDAANNAVEYAANLATQFEAELTLFHALDEMSLNFVLDTKDKLSPGEKELMVEKKMEDYCTATEDSFPISCKPLVTIYNTNLEEGIKHEISKNEYDLVVMGTNGISDLEGFFLGTNSYKLVRKIKSPLLLIPEGCGFKKPKKIVYASDYKTEDISALESLTQLTNKFNSEIIVLHISKNESDKSEEVFSHFRDFYMDKLPNVDIDFERLVGKNTALAIDHFMIEHNPDLLVLLTHHYSFVEKILHESVTKKMTLMASYPILINKF